MARVYTDVEVDVDLTDFETEDLIDELESRGDLPTDNDFDAKEMLNAIWLKRRLGNHDYQTELDQLIYHVIGKVI
jgi:hypothetical protein